MLSILITVLSVLMLLDFSVFELRAFVRALAQRKKLLARNAEHAEYVFARSLAFITVLASCCDSALGTIVISNLLVGTPHEGNTVFIGICSLTYGGGCVVGTILFGRVAKCKKIKNHILGCAIVSFIACGASAFGVYVGSLGVYLVGKFVSTTFILILYTYACNLSMFASDEERATINRDISAAVISGTTIAVLAGGWASEFLGNWAIYGVQLVFVVISIAAVCFLIPKNVALNASKDEEGSPANEHFGVKQLIKVTFSPSVMCILICVFSINMANGYRSFVFPLFANQAGINDSTVSALVALTSALIFLLVPLMDKIESKIGSAYMLAGGIGLLACSYLFFLVDSSIVWAIIALFLVTMFGKVASPSSVTVFQENVRKQNCPYSTSTTIYQLAQNLIILARTPILGALLVFGSAGACGILGVVAAASCGLFLADNRKGKNEAK